MKSMEEYQKKASVLCEALPYIQHFSGKIFVIKYGGNAMLNDELKAAVIQDIALLKYIGIKPVIVHGGGPDITELLTERGIQTEFINGLRVTDEKTMESAQMALVGKTNKSIVSLLNSEGAPAIGFCGIDGKLIECEKQYTKVGDQKVDIGYVGKIIKINDNIIRIMSENDFIPVIAPIGIGTDGHSYNINADTVAGEIAAALKAEKLLLLTDVEGVKESMDSPDVISKLSLREVREYIKKGVITGGMIPKVLGCVDAINNGVKKVHILDGRKLHCLLLEVFTTHGIGTLIHE